MEQQFLLNGLHCAACVRRVETVIGRLPNVELASVNLADQTAFVQGNVSADAVIQAVTKIGFGAELLESEQTRREKQQQQTQAMLTHKKRQFSLALAVGFALMGYGLIGGMTVSEANRPIWLMWAGVTACTMYASGRHFFTGAWHSLKNRAATMDTLIALSTGVAFLYSFYLTLNPSSQAHLYYEASVMIIGFLNLGKFLELKAKQRSSLALEKLLDLAPQQAVVLDGDLAKPLPVKAIKPMMRLQAHTGDRLAVDGIVESGAIWVDESMLTGEALPIEKKAGAKVRAGTLVQDGAGVYIAEQVGTQTALARIIHAVRHAQSSKPPLAQWVDKVAAVFVPVVVSLAVISAAIWLLLGKEFDFALSVFTTVLIIACPCALGLAIPLSTIAGVARAAELGVLVRNIEALQAGSEVDTLVFDKTGTLTTGEMQVSRFDTFNNADRDELLRLAKSLEQHASHPIAKAIVTFCAQHTACTLDNIQIVKGQGIMADSSIAKVQIGNRHFALFRETLTDTEQQQLIHSQSVGTQVFIAVDNRTLGVFYLADQLRPEAKQVIVQFHAQGYQCLMLTGDRQQTAEYYASQLGIEQVIAEVLPEQKAAHIQGLQAEGRKVAMIGDGINDSPALAQANVGIAMYHSSEIAVETADLSLMQSGLQPLAAVLPFSKQVLANMKQSLFGAFMYNAISIPLAAGVLYPVTGWLLNPMIAAAAMALSSVTVVLNSQRLLKK
ncbi:copper-translocating P-type ATPase [Muribacter muris]|uniref:Copper-exporting P-type ATPase n=1 Tax=Muribacter muris TaxID=67855 RepID=A0A4Y9K0I1_9PAST|nr:copper-translocating P-type ATPase [Muribacter muris]MBF0785123.1 copper-translocating P-type ATPase [Muribacter muris]MBF0826863.1 copper-translocating P-type ATPase [Muribacter muris]TFV10215.1 copper-translocating P-type ATPase [Muribacter muris]